MPLCPQCSAQNPDGIKFCGECGNSLASSCSACGTPNEAGRKFCGECGAALGAALPGVAVPAEAPATAAPDPAGRELRLVSVPFADLVGVTAPLESRYA